MYYTRYLEVIQEIKEDRYQLSSNLFYSVLSIDNLRDFWEDPAPNILFFLASISTSGIWSRTSDTGTRYYLKNVSLQNYFTDPSIVGSIWDVRGFRRNFYSPYITTTITEHHYYPKPEYQGLYRDIKGLDPYTLLLYQFSQKYPLHYITVNYGGQTLQSNLHVGGKPFNEFIGEVIRDLRSKGILFQTQPKDGIQHFRIQE